MPHDSLIKFDEIVDRISRQQPFGLSCYAFLSGITDRPDRNAKYLNSYAGHALDLCIRSVQTSLILFCSRHWDENCDSQSIPNAKRYAKRAIDEIVSRHRKYFETRDINRDAEFFRDYLTKLSTEVGELMASPTRQQIRVLRTEYYAHLTTESRDRHRALGDNPSFETTSLTNNSLLSFARKTIELGDQFLYLQQRTSSQFDRQVTFLSEYYDKFWDNLPIFSEIEGPI